MLSDSLVHRQPSRSDTKLGTVSRFSDSFCRDMKVRRLVALHKFTSDLVCQVMVRINYANFWHWKTAIDLVRSLRIGAVEQEFGLANSVLFGIKQHIYLELSYFLKLGPLTFAQLFSCRGFSDSISTGLLPIFRGLLKQVLESVLA